MKKPMLLSNDEYDLNDLDYIEMFGSKKRDGVRSETSNKGILNRSLKVLRNAKMQKYFEEVYINLPDGIILEAEIHSNTLPCREIAGLCNSLDYDVPNDLKLYIFGIYDIEKTFKERIQLLKEIENKYLKGDRYEVVPQILVTSAEDAEKFYQEALKEGYEGTVLMDGRKKYKQGRVTINQHIGFKLKPHKEMDLLITGVTERMENLNKSKTNELGQSYKSNNVDMKKSTGVAATFICKLPNGETTKVPLTGDEAFRREIWENQKSYIGKYAVVKSMAYGTKDKLRHARLLDIKEKVEK